MSTYPSQSNGKKLYHRIALLLGAIAFSSIQYSTVNAGEPQSLRDYLCEVVQLADGVQTRDHANQMFTDLSRNLSDDSRVPYLHALVMVDKSKYKEAVAAAKRLLASNSDNPEAWKVSIWLTVNNGDDFDLAIEAMQQLTMRMNDETSSLMCSVQQADELADFMGRVFGFLSGPGEMDALRLYNAEQQLISYMTTEQTSYFMLGRNSSMDDYEERMQNIGQLRYDAQKTEESIRSSKLANSDKERSYLRDEMTKIESNRLTARQQTSTERNVIAATSGSGYLNSRYYRRPYYGGYAYGAYGGNQWQRGLDDRHYADTNRREHEYNVYLSEREKNLRRRMNNLEKNEERLVRKPNNGNSRKVLSEVSSASILRTYVPFPVKTANEIDRILASY